MLTVKNKGESVRAILFEDLKEGDFFLAYSVPTGEGALFMRTVNFVTDDETCYGNAISLKSGNCVLFWDSDRVDFISRPKFTIK